MGTDDIYLNHAGTSWPKPKAVSQAVRDAMAASPSEWPADFEAAHLALASFFGVEKPEQLLLTPGCTSALAIGIGDAHIEPGKRVLTSSWEHHALHRPLLKLGNTGVQVDYIPPKYGDSQHEQYGPLDLEWLERELSRGDVALVAITAACNVTGELLPYQSVIELAHRFGVRVLIDAAQIVGWQKLNLSHLGADMVAFGGHKGLQAPWGIGGLYISDTIQMECTSATCALPQIGLGLNNKAHRPGYCDVGSVDQYALSGLHAAIQLLQQQDMKANLETARKRIERIRQALAMIDEISLMGSSNPNHRMPTLALSVSSSSNNEIAAKLSENSVIVGSGLQCAPLAHQSLGSQDSGLIRISVGIEQRDEDIDEAINRLQSSIGG